MGSYTLLQSFNYKNTIKWISGFLFLLLDIASKIEPCKLLSFYVINDYSYPLIPDIDFN